MKNPQRRKKIEYFIYPIISLAVVILIWYIAAKSLNVEFILPTPAKTFSEFLRILSLDEFYKGVFNTLLHAVLSFLMAFVAALIFAFLARASSVFDKLFYPVVVIMRVAPTMSVIFLSIIWISSDKAPYLVGVLILFPLLYASFYQSIGSVDKDLIKMADAYGVKKIDKLTGLYLPCVAKNIYSESLSTLSFSVKLAVSGEAISQGGVSIGFLMQAAKAYLETSTLIAYTVAAIIMGFLLELIVRLIAFIVRRIVYAKA